MNIITVRGSKINVVFPPNLNFAQGFFKLLIHPPLTNCISRRMIISNTKTWIMDGTKNSVSKWSSRVIRNYMYQSRWYSSVQNSTLKCKDGTPLVKYMWIRVNPSELLLSEYNCSEVKCILNKFEQWPQVITFKSRWMEMKRLQLISL